MPSPMSQPSDVSCARRAVLGRLYGRAPLPLLVGLDSPLNQVFSLLSRTVTSAEGNSALLIGPRGSGKSSVVQRALGMLEDPARHQSGAASVPKYHVVRLSGFVHITDRIALRDIARQLLVEQDLDNILIGSFADAFAYILNLLRSAGNGGEGAESVPPVLFILEEFDLLAQHPKQSLLYTLFDIAQSQQTPIAVLGVTARIDVMDLLEKRVKSRFSHRQIYVQSPQKLCDFVEIARSALFLTAVTDCVSASYAEQFNARVEGILAAEPIARRIAHIFDFDKDVRQLLRLFVLASSRLSPESKLLQMSLVEASVAQDVASAKLQVLSSVSLLELCLIISMKSLVQCGSSKYNFEMVYSEYKSFMSRHLLVVSAGGSMKVYKKPVALKAFETLVELEIVRPVLTSMAADGGGSYGRNDLLAGAAQAARAPKGYRMVQLMLEPGQVVELVADRVDVPAVIRRWAQQ
ncbi:origin recognition complex subunit 4 [Coemansia thaxteri]|uniref:Origin recognition complex subunit 4 n=1 Tax=Coemansia thaxteri TaxID=2663907 RepID=A0A9W8B7U7_9FUNG|nr:origin recognition complex subunit 4 [Coemansia thaxteri]KAJ2000762.1 origin recognition complex subunit 4 [Coemansia thaxteri]KAJ2468249.1 origin recognition complex subunit 4 [Coemansia sp. RSA 2322]